MGEFQKPPASHGTKNTLQTLLLTEKIVNAYPGGRLLQYKLSNTAGLGKAMFPGQEVGLSTLATQKNKSLHIRIV